MHVRAADGWRYTAAIGLLAIATISAADTHAVETAGGSCPDRVFTDPLKLYGNEIAFRVDRNGKPVGSHTVTFRRDGQDLLVDTRFEVAVEVMFVTAYRYTYEASDRWRDGCLINTRVTVNDDGERSAVEASLDGALLRVSGPNGTTLMPAEVYPTHHWNAGVLGSDAVLNTITGRKDQVRIVERGEEIVPVNGSPLPATRYAYTGDLTNEVWYDSKGRWVKMQFPGKDGSTITYICERCRGSSITASQ